MTNRSLRKSLTGIEEALREGHRPRPDGDASEYTKWRPCLAAVKSAVDRHAWRPTALNIFEVLEIHRFERAHSALLAWLLDPRGSHGVGNQFLRSFLEAAGIQADDVGLVAVSRELRCGGGYVDVHAQGSGWSLYVEVKVDALEKIRPSATPSTCGLATVGSF